ncbi:hypothetical protein WN48_09665 [Eufriesea mexicana]|uniref:Uncharacterized protein n=1 Tax=Eufriesea mexicana TaxID=516756 RepID=A0A310SJR4_9HYME|nr:hypothetical protein WN48_09665 [Eufriesea mexicana]
MARRDQCDHYLKTLSGYCKIADSMDSTISLKPKANIDVLGVHEAQSTTRAPLDCDN